MVSFQSQSKKSGKGIPDPVDIHAGARLRLRRNLVGMSQEQLGNALGLTFQQIQKYERGINRISASRLHQICKILNVSVDYFFDEMPVASDNNRPGMGEHASHEGMESNIAHFPDVATEREMLQGRETLDLIRAYYRITDAKKRRTIVELIKSMADSET